MTQTTDQAGNPDAVQGIGNRAGGDEPLWQALLRLARPKQWTKSSFVAVGPFFGGATSIAELWGVLLAMVAFALASSGCYVINDLRDAQADRLHPRKRRRPIASGRVSPKVAKVYALALWILAAGCVAALGPLLTPVHALGLGAVLAIYVGNVSAYSLGLKHVPVLDVLGLALGFVLRVLGGCAAVGITPSTWLLNVTLFLAMFLAFGKRLGERRTLGADAAAARAVQGVYTDELLRMMVVVTAVAMLLTYAGYVQDNESRFVWVMGDRFLGGVETPRLGMNLLWLTMLPATYAVLRSIVLLERGEFDDPTELATRDKPFQLAALAFVALTAGLVLWAGPAHRPQPVEDSLSPIDASPAAWVSPTLSDLSEPQAASNVQEPRMAESPLGCPLASRSAKRPIAGLCTQEWARQRV
ncbi:MAG: decaprenyl-phosphate phosphoribosyltransferase [Phycisphaerales bacterium]